MSITLLQHIAAQDLPIDIDDLDQVDELWALMDAGLIAALRVRAGRDGDVPGIPLVRILAITGDGRRLIQRCACAH